MEESTDFEGAEVGIDQDISALNRDLTNAGKYAYAGMCAVTMNKLFYSNDLDRPFCEKSLKCILTHLDLPPTVQPIMDMLLKGEMENTIESFRDILEDEPTLEGNLKPILHDIITLAVQEGSYDARWRVLIRDLSAILDARFEEMELYEITIVHCLTKEQHMPSKEELKSMKRRERIAKAKRYALIGLATVGGGTILGVTGGLTAPLIGAGLVSVIGSSALLTTLSGAAMVGTLFGAAGAGLAGYKMNKRVGEIEEFAFGQLCPYADNGKDGMSSVATRQLDITIALSGWIKDEDEDNFTRPWTTLCSSREQYYLRYESSYLLELGRAMDYIMSIALTMVTQEALKYTILSGLMSAIAWPAGLVGLASVIDNPWGVCCRRSAQVGKQLADVLLNREHGHRPVTLIGYSLGARAIYYCLREMSYRENSTGLIQDAILIGAPCSGNPKKWEKICKVVAGDIINGYCKTDWLLRFLYRTLSMPRGGVAGLQPLEAIGRRLINYDLSHIVSGHGDYPDKMHDILQALGVRVVDVGEIPSLTSSRSHDNFSPQDVEKDIRKMSKSSSDSAISDSAIKPK